MNEFVEKKRYWGWGVALFVVVVVIFAVSKLPRGFSEDLSIIGQGSPVAVVVHDKDDLHSHNLLTMIDEIRGDYANRIQFRIVDTGVRQGAMFSETQRVSGATLVLFGVDGQRITVLVAVSDTAELVANLDSAFNFF